MKRLSILLILLLALPLSAAGLNDGSSWEDAWTNLASVTWTRGDTYYIAGGTYTEAVTISPGAGTSWVTLKKANATDNSGDAGWDASFATDVAAIDGGNPALLSIDRTERQPPGGPLSTTEKNQ